MGDPLEKVLEFNAPDDFDFDEALIDVDPVTSTKLILLTNPGLSFDEHFSSADGFTIPDPTKAEITGGKAQQKNMRPTNGTFGATFTNNINGSWGNGILTGTAFGGAAVSGGKLDLTGGTVKYVSYAGTDNANNYQKGTIKFKFTPDWTGVSIGTQCLFDISRAGAGDVNSISIRTVSGLSDLTLRLCDQNGNYIVNAQFGGFSAVSGTTYNFQLNYDFTLGQTRLYIDGVNIGGLHTGTGTRSGLCNQFYIGTTNGAVNIARFKIDDFEIFSEVQAAPTAPGSYSVPEADYEATSVTLPTFHYAGVGSIQSVGDVTILESGTPKYITGGYWWDGAAWVVSNGTYSEANTAADFAAHVIDFPVVGESDVVMKVVFTDSNTISWVDDFHIEITGQIYDDSSPSVLNIADDALTNMDGMKTFVEDADKPAGTNIKYTIIRNGAEYWFDGSEWAVVTSFDGTQANTASEINSNVNDPDFLSLGYSCMVAKAYLISDGTATPTLRSITFKYEFFESINDLAKCWVYGYVLDNDEAVEGATIKVVSNPFWDGIGNLISINESVLSNELGYFEVQLVETESTGNTAKVTIKWTDENGKSRKKTDNIIVPDEVSAELDDCIV